MSVCFQHPDNVVHPCIECELERCAPLPSLYDLIGCDSDPVDRVLPDPLVLCSQKRHRDTSHEDDRPQKHQRHGARPDVHTTGGDSQASGSTGEELRREPQAQQPMHPRTPEHSAGADRESRGDNQNQRPSSQPNVPGNRSADQGGGGHLDSASSSSNDRSSDANTDPAPVGYNRLLCGVQSFVQEMRADDIGLRDKLAALFIPVEKGTRGPKTKLGYLGRKAELWELIRLWSTQNHIESRVQALAFKPWPDVVQEVMVAFCTPSLFSDQALTSVTQCKTARAFMHRALLRFVYELRAQAELIVQLRAQLQQQQ